MRRLVLLVALLAVAACGPKVNPQTPFDEDDPRAGRAIDAGVPVDAAPPIDAAAPTVRTTAVSRAVLTAVLDAGPADLLASFEKRGFAYSVYSYFAPQRVDGPFQIGLQTRGSQTEDALMVVRQTLDTFIAEGPTEAELQAARDNMINGFGLRLDSNRKILDHNAMIGFYQLRPDWLDHYPQAVAAVTREQVQDAFARRIRPAHLITVIAGGDGDTAAAATTPRAAR